MSDYASNGKKDKRVKPAKDKQASASNASDVVQAKNYSYMQNRELSWLEFNKRVLDQGADTSVPLFDRLNFVSIFWSNLQEFFMIRVGSLTDLLLLKKEVIDNKSGLTPKQQLDAIYAKCHDLAPYYDNCYKTLRKEFAPYGIIRHKAKSLNDEQKAFIEEYFDANVMPLLSPQIVNSRHPFPHLTNGALYVIVRLDDEVGQNPDVSLKKRDSEVLVDKPKDKSKDKAKSAKNQGAEGVTLGIIPMPVQCKRIVRLPGDGLQFILLEHIIEMFVSKIFYMYKVKHTNIICVTRNADLDAVEGEEEQGADYRDHIKRILKKRTRLAPVRLESERELSQTVLPVLLKRLKLKNYQVFTSAAPLDMSYVYALPSMVEHDVGKQLSMSAFTPQWPACIDRNSSIIQQIEQRDILVSYPYETMDVFVELLRECIHDPDVVSINITLYRLASHSHIAECLIAAAEAGKDVTALCELRARFDESNNIEWSQRLEEAGCRVIYGFRDYKVHSKLCCITRQKDGEIQYITQAGTGNYNEKTAKLYTDFSFMTADEKIGRDAAKYFRNMTLENLSDDYDTLWVAPLQIKQNIIHEIDNQIANKKAGLPAGLFFKTNSITDKEIIEKIVEASQAGVTCTLLVRGISCIVPGVCGYTDNVCVVSIVGRLLEHSRIYLFGPFDGDFKVYLSSADLMTRNMDKRVEVAWPIQDKSLREDLLRYIAICLSDTAKLRDLMPNKKYTKLGYFAREDGDGGHTKPFDSQNYLLEMASQAKVSSVDSKKSDVDSAVEHGKSSENVEESAEEENSTTQFSAWLPNIKGLYVPETNPEGKFVVPRMDGGTAEIKREGGPVIAEEAPAVTEAQVEAENNFSESANLNETEKMLDEANILKGQAGDINIPERKPSIFKRIFRS